LSVGTKLTFFCEPSLDRQLHDTSLNTTYSSSSTVSLVRNHRTTGIFNLQPSTSDASLKSAFKLFKTSGVTPTYQLPCLPVFDCRLTSPMSPFERTMPLDLNPYSKSCFAFCNLGTLARFLSCSISSTVLDMTYRCNSTSLMALFLICMLACRTYMRMVGCATDDGPSSINQRYRHCSGFRHATG